MKIIFFKNNTKGFILPFTMLISAIVLFIMGSSMTLISKQLYFSKIYKQSQTAYYAADDAISCAIAIDDTYLAADGLGIFPHSTTTEPTTYIDDVLDYVNQRRADKGLSAISLDEIACAQSLIFDPVVSEFAVAPTTFIYNSPSNGTEEGKTTTYKMRMDTGNGSYRCTQVTINKTQSYRQIIAQGFAQCDNPNGTVERAVVNTTITE